MQVNAINPGPIRTDRFQTRVEVIAKGQSFTEQEAEAAMIRDMNITRIGETEDIAHLVSFLVSPHGRFLQGALIDMDGGQTKTL